MFWFNFLHFYQPANLETFKIKEALDKSYWRLIRLLEEHPDLHFTLNISGCLVERLFIEKELDFLRRLRRLVDRGQVELTGSAAYHAFLPFLPAAEVIRQIKENEIILKRHFGKNLKLRGFFFPEMAYSAVVAQIVRRLGYRWTILDEISYAGRSRLRPNPNCLYIDKQSGLQVVFRNRRLSSAYVPDQLKKILLAAPIARSAKIAVGDKIIITATDSELYGLRHEDQGAELEKIVKRKDLKTATLSWLVEQVSRLESKKIKVFPASWETSPAEMRLSQPYKLWLDRSNKIQVSLWKLAALALQLSEKFKTDKNKQWQRWHLVRGLASCTFWWASGRDFSEVFGPRAWSPDEIERGLEDLIRAVRSIADPRSRVGKLQAEKYYWQIKKIVWEEHWKKYWRK